MFLHGSGPGVTGHRNFRGVLPTFSRHFRCLVLEFPGFGVSPDLGGHPMIAAHGAAMSFIDALSLDRFDIIGNSMGGGVGINLAIQHPQRVRRLVTIGGIGTNLFTPGPSEGIRLLQEFTEDPTRQRLIDWLNSMVYDPALITDELIEERWGLASDPQTLQSARRMYSKAAFAKMTAMMAKSDAPLPWATMHKVAAPTLLTWGRDDRVSPAGHGDHSDAHHPQRRIARVPQLRALGDDRGQGSVRIDRAGVFGAPIALGRAGA